MNLSKSIGSRMDALREYVQQLPKGCHVLETGTMRGVSPAHITGDGWSTAILAYEVYRLRGTLVTVDIHDRSEILKAAIPEKYLKHVFPVVGNTRDILPTLGGPDDVPWDMVLFDSNRDPEVILHEFSMIDGNLSKNCFLAIDDSKVKGKLLVPHLEAQGWGCFRVEEPQVWKR